MQERLDEIKRFDKLNEEDQAIIDDADASEFDKEAAKERMAERKEEFYQQREEPLRERVREIFKKIRRDSDCHLSGRRRHNRSGCRGNHQRFEIHGQSIGKWS